VPNLWKRILGRRLNYLRRVVNKEKSVASLIEVTEVSESGVLQWENGETRPDPDNLMLIADYYAVPLDYLCCRDLQDLSEADKEHEYNLPRGHRDSKIDRPPNQVSFEYGLRSDVIHG
jgi:transcriptional regulator with XRE-family HTH domain